MSGIIGFLERMGRDSQLRHATAEELARALNEAGIEETTSRSLLCGDVAMLQSTLEVDRTLCCLVYSPREDEEEEVEEEHEDDGDEDAPESEPKKTPEKNAPRK